MKKKIIIIRIFAIFLCALFILNSFSISAQKLNSSEIKEKNYINLSNSDSSWSVEIIDIDGMDPYASMILDSEDNPHIAYDTGACEFRYAVKIDSIWSVEKILYNPYVGGIKGVSLALDSHNIPHISFIEQYDLMYGTKHGSTWFFEKIDDIGDLNTVTSIAIDTHDVPHIAYIRSTDTWIYYVMYATITGSSWSIETVTENLALRNIDLALDSHDQPHIVFVDDSSNHLCHAEKTGEDWVIETVDDDFDLWYYECRIAIDSYDRPHILYEKTPEANCREIKYATKDGLSWSIEKIDDGYDYVFWGLSLALDTGNIPHLSYIRAIDTWSYFVMYATKKDGKWKEPEAIEFPTNGVDYTSICVDSNNIPHIIYNYYSETSGCDITVLRYVTISDLPYPVYRPEKPIGPTVGAPNKKYTYHTSAVHPFGRKMKFGWDWNGDLKVDEWTDYYESGETIIIDHIFPVKGTYYVMVVTKDEYNTYSDFSEYITISMPKNKKVGRLSFNPILEKLMGQFALLERLLNLL